MKPETELNEDLVTLMANLKERRKELDCLYRLEELLQRAVQEDIPLPGIFREIVLIIPNGWQFPRSAQAKIIYQGEVVASEDYEETPLELLASISIQGNPIGKVIVSYKQDAPGSGEKIFLDEELQLIKTIADRISHFILHKDLKASYNRWQEAEEKLSHKASSQWRTILELMENTNLKLFMYLSQKMLYYLCWNGVSEAKTMLQQTGGGNFNDSISSFFNSERNQPSPKKSFDKIITVGYQIFKIASENLGDDMILLLIRQWIETEKSLFLVKALENPNICLDELLNVLTQFQHLQSEGVQLSPSSEKSVRVSLIRYFLSEQLEFIKIAKNYIQLSDYHYLIKSIVYPNQSHGRLGGKSAGLFLASRIIKQSDEYKDLLKDIKTPKTWYITAESFLEFLHYNNLENILEQKYKEMDEIHVEYPNIIQIFKNSTFPPEILRRLTMALEDLGEKPIIVRSSSLLEDRMGAAFSGKYKSLFLANQGTWEERMNALQDAIGEVYASTFSPDAIEYRKEMGLLDFHEEMGIMIQEVIGNRVGKYFLPTFAGVAFSRNEFRWSARIDKEDGLIRLVPGLGTRAVDRVADDYPILIAPGKPDLRVNMTADEKIRYSPKNIDVINLETNTFETVTIDQLIKGYGEELPWIQHLVSIAQGDDVHNPTSLLNIDFENQKLIVTFESLFQNTSFVKQIAGILTLLEEKMNIPVDIEFAHDGRHLFLLQCRSQNFSRFNRPVAIPQDLDQSKIVFSAHRHITNGFVPDITHVVYVDPESYNRLEDLAQLKAVGRAVGKLNKLLPKRQFILMGPGRWGSRGDIKLGVNVTYSDINNTAVLIEMALKKGNYLPELSFGTHFFQDLVEASIRYLPLYPDDSEAIFNEAFFTRNENILPQLLPEYATLADTLHVIDVSQSTGGNILRILMNADLDQAVCLMTQPGDHMKEIQDEAENDLPLVNEDFWRWRYLMAERIAERMDFNRFGVNGMYVFGSTKNATAGPCSDIDILIHFNGSQSQRKELMIWLEGWSLSLSELNFQRTGYTSKGLLDVHLVTDEDIRNKTSYAVKIGAVTDAARPLRVNAEG